MMWKNSRPEPQGKYHLDSNGNPLYNGLFKWVLPFHAPGLAPVEDESGSYHIKPDGKPAYHSRFDRTFGFYQGRAAVILDGNWFHILPNGSKLNEKACDWCGNFQNGRSPVRCDNGDYYHIRLDGSVVPNGPWGYAGDYREDIAVVREKDGLCWHIDPEGKPIHNQSFFDLGVFHKGLALARDASGWFHINKHGKDVSGRRYENLEPFYNGQASAQLNNGQRVIIDEAGKIIHILPFSDTEAKVRLHQIAVSSWIPLAIKLGLDVGLADGEINSRLLPLAKKVLQEAWMELGLLEEDGKRLTVLGKRLKAGSVERDRLKYWLGPELIPWLEGDQHLTSEKNCDWFKDISSNREVVALTQRVLNSYAKEDWDGIGNVIPVNDARVIVDLGGGIGALLRDIQCKYPTNRFILFERPDVVDIISPTNDFEVIPGNLFNDSLPEGDLYILSRVLHDWPDVRILKILKRLADQFPKHARLSVIERIKDRPKQHGLLSLHMYLVHGSFERDLKQWKSLFEQCGWGIENMNEHGDHWVLTLKQQNSDLKYGGSVI